MWKSVLRLSRPASRRLHPHRPGPEVHGTGKRRRLHFRLQASNAHSTCCDSITHRTYLNIPLKKGCAQPMFLVRSLWGVGDRHMKTVIATLATCAVVLSFAASADAASLASIQGMVQINNGSGFHQVAREAEVNPGTSIMTAPGASAEIRYSDECRVPVKSGSIEVVAPIPPCGPPILSAIQGDTVVGADPDGFVRSQILRDNRDSLY